MSVVSKYFQELVRIDSPSGGESAVRSYIQHHLLQLGFSTRIDTVGNLYASIYCGKEALHPILLCAHMDTVQEQSHIEPIVRDGYVESVHDTILGADDKASIAAMLCALEITYKNSTYGPPLELLFTVREETGGGVEHFPVEWIKSTQIIVCDLSVPLGTIGIKAPYITNFSVQLFGKSAHSSKPSLGINAILGMQEILSKIPIGRIDNKRTTINVGVIKGGEMVNSIPKYCEISGEVRSFDEKLFNQHCLNIESNATRIAKAHKLKLVFKKSGYCPGYIYNESDHFLQRVGSIINQACTLTTLYKTTFGVSDANILANKGFLVALMSNGVQNPHTSSEKVSLDSLNKLAKIIERIIKDENWNT